MIFLFEMTLKKFMSGTQARQWILLFFLGTSGVPLNAAPTNALDRIDFGNLSSETAHQFNPKVKVDKLPLAGLGALGQSYRAPVPVEGEVPKAENDQLTFTAQVDRDKQNYLTVRLWGGDQQTAGLMLLAAPRGYGALDWNGTGGPPSFPNRFYYTTIPIPLEKTKGKSAVTLSLYECNAPTGLPGRPIYSAYTHTAPMFVPDSSDPTGTAMPLTGELKPKVLDAVEVLDFLRANRAKIYGPDGYYEKMLSRQIMPGSAGAPPEVMGLDLWNPVGEWLKEPRSEDDWRDQAGGHGHGGGFGTNPDELLSVLTSTYFLPPFQADDGKVVEGLDHFHDESILQRIVLALDACTYVQSSDGSYNDQGEDSVNKMSAQGHWQGLTSKARAQGHPYAGSTKRGGGWSLTLEGANTATLGWVVLQLINDPVSAPLFKNRLEESFDADLNGGSMKRVHAYERMLNNQLAYQVRIYGGGTVAQALMATNSIYTNLVALLCLERLYPYPGKESGFSESTVHSFFKVPYPALTAQQGSDYLKQSTGLEPVTSIMGGLYNKDVVNYPLSKQGLGEAGGTRSGGYDGRYGSILPWMTSRLAQTAVSDASLDPGTLAQLRKMAGTAVDSMVRFVSSQEQFRGITNLFTFAQEDFVTYRDPYNANANANGFTTESRYVVSDPRGGMSTPLSRRAAYLEVLYQRPPSDLQYLKDLGAYEETLRALIGVKPEEMTALPGEPGQPDSAWVDVQTGATAAYYRGERFYLNANWRNGDIAGVGNVTNLARIHLTTSTLDRTALVFMPHDGTTVQNDGNLSGKLYQPWVVSYGAWLVMGNPSEQGTELRLPWGSGNAVDLISGKKYPMGSAIPVPAGKAAVVVLSLDFSQPCIPGNEPTISGGTYTLISALSGLVLDKGLKQQSASEEKGQKWIFSYRSGTYTIQNAATGEYLDGSDGLKLQKKSGKPEQSWILVSNGIGFTFFNKANSQCLDVLYGYKDIGREIIIHGYGGGPNQIWHLEKVLTN